MKSLYREPVRREELAWGADFATLLAARAIRRLPLGSILREE